MWIETPSGVVVSSGSVNSFASNGECGLKHVKHYYNTTLHLNSFASNGECGLKLRLWLDLVLFA